MISRLSRVRAARSAPTPGVDAAIEIAVEHIAWCLNQGWSPYDVFAAIGEPAPLRPGWNDAIWAVAKAAEDLRMTPVPAIGRVA